MTLVDLLASRARTSGARRAFTFLVDGETSAEHLSYAELEAKARTIAVELIARGATGGRALLLYPPGLDFIAAFFGCLYAGVAAVPVYPPDPARLDRTLPRLSAIVEDAQATIALTTRPIAGMADHVFALAPSLGKMAWLATDELVGGSSAFPSVDVRPDSIAFLQYTSGSTGTPKGVVLTHTNLLHNSRIIQQGFAHDEHTLIVGWLPLYHDMGLVGGLLQPVYHGVPAVLMSPIAFLQKPLRWLQAITKYRATTTGGPNFAFDLCARKVKPEEVAALDLSSWKVAVNGAEPVRAETIERFTQRFAPAGFRREVFYPCYGLAEASLMVTGGTAGALPRLRRVSRGALAAGRIEDVGSDEGQTFVGTGRVLGGQDVRIVDPDRRVPVPERVVGEIWVRGASVALGYWGRAEQTEETFGAHLVDGQGPYLRTGDLGFFEAGELFITGRRKDLIILRGRNLYPQDLERTVEQCSPALRPGCGAAFPVEVDGEERVVVVHEVDRRAMAQGETPAGLLDRIGGMLAEAHEVVAHEIVLIPAGAIPKTSSGKIQRRATRAEYLAGRLEPVASRRGAAEVLAPDGGADTSPQTREAEESLIDGLRRVVARVLGTSIGAIDPEQPLSHQGVDSIAAVEIQHAITVELGREFSLDELLSGASLAALAARVAAVPGETGDDRIVAEGPRERGPLSFGQEALRFVHELAPGSSAYHVAGAVRVREPFDEAALERAFAGLVGRHAALRTRFHSTDGEVEQVVVDERGPIVRVIEHASPEEERAALGEEVDRPFDLSQGPLLRVTLHRRAEASPVLLLVVHHSVIDFWSLGIFVEELGARYAAERGEAGASSRQPKVEYVDYARWQRDPRRAAVMERNWVYFKRELEGELPVVELPFDRPRPRTQTYAGAARPVRISAATSSALRELAVAESTTAFVALLVGFEALLHRYTGQADVLIGIPAAGRVRPELSDVMGYFVNALPLRLRAPRDESMRSALGRVRERVLGALEHQALPFSQIVSRLGIPRDASRSPLFQVMFVLQQSGRGEDPALTAFTLGEEGARLRVGGLELESVALERRSAALDLTVMLAAQGDELVASFQYNRDLFDAETIDRLGAHYVRLLEAAVARPDAPLASLSILSEQEQRRLLVEWNASANHYPKDKLVHELFAEQAAKTPDAIALVFDGARLTYRELDERSNQLAHYLGRRGVGFEDRVGVCVSRSFEMVVGLLGVLKAGAAYVPLDPGYPRERLELMLEDSSAKLLVTTARLAGELALGQALPRVSLDEDWREVAGESALSPSFRAHADQSAYVIFTSGSTGRPKGVVGLHRATVNRLSWMFRVLPFQPGEVCCQKTALSFVDSIWEIFGPLLSGVPTVLIPDAQVKDPDALVEILAEARVSRVVLVPSLLRALLEVHGAALGERLPALRLWSVSGEALPLELIEAFARSVPNGRLINLFGSSEVAGDATAELDAHAPATRGSIGGPIDNTQVYLLDRELRLVPQGTAGELYVGGLNLARGYAGRPDLTAERFLPSPFTPGARLYWTGDLARWRPDGRLEYLRRVDHQVKIRGVRVEIGEVEAAFKAEAGVAQVVVVARDAGGGQKRLVAYVVGDVKTSALEEAIARRLPEYMMPSAIVVLPALPLTPNGKVDHHALPPPRQGDESAHVAPRTLAEEKLAEVWKQVLGVERVGVRDGFFALGGHSLLATRLVSQVRKVFEVELSVRAVFDAPTVEGLAKRVEALRTEGKAAQAPIDRVSREGALELSYAQERLWFIEQLEPGRATYNMPAALRLEGELDVRGFEVALEGLVERHESLRTCFVSEDGRARQVIAASFKLALSVEVLEGSPEEKRTEAEARAAVEAQTPFDLARGSLLRARLLRIAVDEHVLLFTMHHIVSDGWSMGVLVREVAELYRAHVQKEAPRLEPLLVQYADYAAWQRKWLSGAELERQRGYWKERLGGAPALLTLPTDHPRPAQQSYRGAAVPVVLGAELSRAVNALCQSRGLTPFMALLGGFAALLSRHSGQRDVVVGTPIANRTRREVEGLIGFFVNTLALRVEVSAEERVEELLRAVKASTLSAYEHQEMPFEQVVEALEPERSLGHAPVFQTMFAMQNAPMETLELPGLRLGPIAQETTTAKFDLTLELGETERGFEGRLEYATDLFERATVERMAGHLGRLLEGMVANPGAKTLELELLSAEERHQLLVEWNARANRYPKDKLVHQWFAEQAAKTPDAVAVVFEATSLTYRELDERSNQLAHYLQKRGVGPDVLVGICVERSLEMVVGLLGILKAGGAYVPLDPTYPAERIAHMLVDARPVLVLTKARLVDTLPQVAVLCLDRDWTQIAEEPATVVATRVRPENLIYVIFTSGSTGRPKGAMLSHQGVVNYLSWAIADYGVEQGRGSVVHSSIAFDLTVTSLLCPLLVGRMVTLVPEDRGIEQLERVLREEKGFSLLKITPSHLDVLRLRLEPSDVRDVARVLVIGGEQLTKETLQFWQAHAPSTRLINEYGPTETVVGCSTYEVRLEREASGAIPIGVPVANMQMYVLDGAFNPAPVGVAGELYIGGAQLGRGYLGRAALTAERFVPNPFSIGTRLYRSGDLARWLPDGTLEYLGRIDHQVKVRGFRIELGEIEAALVEQPGVGNAVVVAREDRPGDRRLVAYVAGEVEVAALRTALERRLPSYMVPTAFVVLGELPLTPNGKVDRKALPAPEMGGDEAEHVAPRTLAEEKLAKVWREVLGVERVGVRDHFFELGGDSILSIQVVSRARAAGVEVTPKQLFEHPRLEDLARAATGGAREIEAEQGLVVGEVERVPIEGWFFEHGEEEEPWHFNQALLLRVSEELDEGALETALSALVKQHDGLRVRYGASGGTKVLTDEVPVLRPLKRDFSALGGEALRAALEEEATKLQRTLRLDEGLLMRAGLYELGSGERRLLLAMHHLAVDGVSWRVLLEDLGRGYEQASRGKVVELGPKTTSIKAWAEKLGRWAKSERAEKELEYWKAQASAEALLPKEGSGDNLTADAQTLTVELGEHETESLLREVPPVYQTQVNDALLLALVEAFEGWTGETSLRITLEGHGREALFEEVDLSRTVGWFTALFPVRLDVNGTQGAGERLKWVKEQLRAIPNRGVGYGALKYLGRDEVRDALLEKSPPEVSFNYLGQLDQALSAEGFFSAASEPSGEAHSRKRRRDHLIDVNAQVSGGRLRVAFTYSDKLHTRATVKALAEGMQQSLRGLIEHCRRPDAGGFTPSDVLGAQLGQGEIDLLLAKVKKR